MRLYPGAGADFAGRARDSSGMIHLLALPEH
jgi:hypothetical protein